MNNKKKDKKFLSEAQIKRFMVLSGNKALSDSFLKKLNETEQQEEVEEISEEISEENTEENVEENVFKNSAGDKLTLVKEVPVPKEEPIEDDDMEMEEPETTEKADENVIKKLVDAIADAIQSVSGVQVTVSSGEEAAAVEPGTAAMDDESEEEMPSAYAKEEEEEEEEGELKEEKELVSKNPKKVKGQDQKMKPIGMPKKLHEAIKKKQFANEVAKRVAHRLIQEIKKSSKKH